jgi:hypothetical protein
MLRRLLPALAMIALVAAPAAAEIGRIKRVYGHAEIVRGDKTLPATPGALLLEHDILQTGPDGRISLAFVDNTRFSIGPASRIDVAQFRFDETTHSGSRFETKVDRGSLAIVSGQIAHESKDAMKVRTPTSLLGVRGTRFVVDVH